MIQNSLSLITNDTVLVNDEVINVLGYSADGQPLICPDNVTTVQRTRLLFSYPVGYLELTYIGCSLSVIGSALVLMTYGLFKELCSLSYSGCNNLHTSIKKHCWYLVLTNNCNKITDGHHHSIVVLLDPYTCIVFLCNCRGLYFKSILLYKTLQHQSTKVYCHNNMAQKQFTTYYIPMISYIYTPNESLGLSGATQLLFVVIL